MLSFTEVGPRKDYENALRLFAEMQDRDPSKYPPVIGNFNPKNVPIKWTDSEKFEPDLMEKVIVLTGWNFNPDGKSLKAECRNADGEVVKDATQSLKVSSRYFAQLDIATGSGLGFQPDIKEVVLIQADKVLARVPVVWGNRPPKPVLITALGFTYRTMDEDKDNDDGHVHAGVYWKGKIVGEGPTQSQDDPKKVWKDNSIKGPFELKLTNSVPYDNVSEMKVEIRHFRSGGDPAWRFRVQRVSAVLSDATENIVLTEDDQAQKDLYNHRPSRQTWHSFDLRGRKNDVHRTPQIPLSKR